jgi:hypothetical protein
MTDDRTLERAARSWLEQGPTQAPDRAVDAALSRIQTVRQERGRMLPLRFPTMNIRVLGAASATILVVAAVGVLALPRLTGTGPGGQASLTPTSTVAATVPPASPPRPTPLPSFDVHPAPSGFTEVHVSQLYRYAMRYPATWTLEAGTSVSSPDSIPNLGAGFADFYGDGVASGVMVLVTPVSAARGELSAFADFISVQVPAEYTIYSGSTCTRATRTLQLDGEPAREFDYLCAEHSALWVVAIHDGLAYQVAWLDDGPFTLDDLRPKLDAFLQSFTFAP